jgi:hypothetical protein
MQDEIYFSKRQVAQRYNVTIKTVERWVERGWLPEPAFTTGEGPGKRSYWSVLRQLIPFERKWNAA